VSELKRWIKNFLVLEAGLLALRIYRSRWDLWFWLVYGHEHGTKGAWVPIIDARGKRRFTL
jgi:hypothetical protein